MRSAEPRKRPETSTNYELSCNRGRNPDSARQTMPSSRSEPSDSDAHPAAAQSDGGKSTERKASKRGARRRRSLCPEENRTAAALPVNLSSCKKQDDDDTLIPTRDARQRQKNRVGKRYRDKLSGEFEALQAALHADHDDEIDENALQAGGGEHRMPLPEQQDQDCSGHRVINKAKVLDLARERVRELLREREALRAEMDALLREKQRADW